MSLINTNYSYLQTMGIGEESPLVGVIVSVYYLGCAVGAVIASRFADAKGRKPGIFACLATSSFGNLLMFVAGLGGQGNHTAALTVMIIGRVVMGLGVGKLLNGVSSPKSLHLLPQLGIGLIRTPTRWHRCCCSRV